MKTMEQFWSEISTNEELAEKLEQIASEQELEALLKENEVSGTTEDFKALVVAKAKESGELSDEQLEAVSGGIDWQECGREILNWFKSMFKG